ncbi:acetyl esterase [Catenulispora sp. GP43]|uniref:alpha/beta hydrolase n=1 Tax=Catenulispora sp. GP43 TaxID=3156263 RepID=UPI0035171F58
MSETESVLEPAAQAFVDAAGEPPLIHQLGPEKGRLVLDFLQDGDLPVPAADVEDLVVPGGPSGAVTLRIFRPVGSGGPLPVVLYIHGAGWVFGNARTHNRLVRELAVRARAATVFVDYSLSPEAKYPVAIEEIYAALLWLAEHGAAHGLDGRRIAVAGDCVGGTMAAAITMLAKRRGGPVLAGQSLFYPVTDAAFDTDSYDRFAEGYFLTRERMRWFWDQYTTDPAERVNVTAAPLRATPEELAGLPPALVIVAEADVVRDEGEAYAAALRAAGVPTTAVRYDGVIHDFMVLDAMRGTQAAMAATRQAADFLREVLHP